MRPLCINSTARKRVFHRILPWVEACLSERPARVFSDEIRTFATAAHAPYFSRFDVKDRLRDEGEWEFMKDKVMEWYEAGKTGVRIHLIIHVLDLEEPAAVTAASQRRKGTATEVQRVNMPSTL